MDEGMEGWMDEWMEGRRNGGMDEGMEGWMKEWMATIRFNLHRSLVQYSI